MPASLAFCRRSLLIAAVLLVAVALVIPAAVIPPVRADTFPGATPWDAVPAFWTIVIFHVCAAAVAGSTAAWTTTERRPLPPLVLVVLALLLLLSAYALEEPGRAYTREGPAMQAASVFVLACAASDLVAAVLVITAASFLPKRARAG